VYNSVVEELPGQEPIRKVVASGDVILAGYPQLVATVRSKKETIERVGTLDDLSLYYNVVRELLVDIKKSSVEKLYNWVRDWRSGVSKPILLITGKPAREKENKNAEMKYELTFRKCDELKLLWQALYNAH
jgi:hypothetical protein